MGPVRRVRTEVAKLTSAGGACRKVSSDAGSLHTISGETRLRISISIAGSNLTGKEVYKYDERKYR
jgi:hypothetical protein